MSDGERRGVMYRFIVRESTAKNGRGQWFWTGVHLNGETIERSSELYERRGDCETSLRNMLDAIQRGDYQVIVHTDPKEGGT